MKGQPIVLLLCRDGHNSQEIERVRLRLDVTLWNQHDQLTVAAVSGGCRVAAGSATACSLVAVFSVDIMMNAKILAGKEEGKHNDERGGGVTTNTSFVCCDR
jgi:hypothetical protein